MKIRGSAYYLFCMLAMMLTIFIFSTQPAKETAKTSDIITKPVENVVKANTDKSFKDEKEEKAYWKKIQSKITVAVRKSAHFILFAILAFFTYGYFKSLGLNTLDCVMLTILVCFLYGLSDEIHQKFVKGRTCRPEDICIDMSGATVMMLLKYFEMKLAMVKNIRTLLYKSEKSNPMP